MSSQAANLNDNYEQARESALCYQQFAELFTYPKDENLGKEALAERQLDFHNSFDCSVNDNACSLNHTDHNCPDRNGRFEELLRFYNFYGLSRDENAEQPDHLSLELQFMHFLSSYEGACQSDGRKTEDLKRAQQEFLTRFLLPFCESIRGKLHDENSFYTQLSGQLHQFLIAETQRLAA